MLWHFQSTLSEVGKNAERLKLLHRLAERSQKRKEDRENEWLAKKREEEQRRREEELKREREEAEKQAAEEKARKEEEYRYVPWCMSFCEAGVAI